MSDQLADIRPNKGAVGTLDALNAAIDHLGEHANAKREILFLVSDFQRLNWDSLPETSIQQTAELIKNQRVPANSHIPTRWP